MKNDILQRFLDERLLDLGEDPKRFDDLKVAAERVAESLRENPRQLANSASVLLGGQLADSEPVLELCREAIIKQWPTYRSRFPSDTIQLFRAILLEAIAGVTKDTSNPTYAAIVFYSTHGLLPYLATARENSIFREFLFDLGQQVEAEASRHWIKTSSALSGFQNDDELSEIPSIDTNWLKQALKNAAGPSGKAGANQQWPGSNAEWLEHYGDASAAAISESIGAVLKELLPTIQEQHNAIQTITSILHQGLGDNLRADVLYWKTALFSQARNTSYRELSEDSAVYWMAWDLHCRIPRFHPESVEFFLRETARAAIGDRAAKKKLTLEQFSSAIRSEAEFIGREIQLQIPTGHRLTPLEAVYASVTNALEPDTASSHTGIPPQTAISRDEIAVLLFRDFQVLRLAGDK